MAEKRIKEFKVKTEQKNEVIEATKEKLDRQQQHLDHKKSELDAILKETEKEEKLLIAKSFCSQSKARVSQVNFRPRPALLEIHFCIQIRFSLCFQSL